MHSVDARDRYTAQDEKCHERRCSCDSPSHSPGGPWDNLLQQLNLEAGSSALITPTITVVTYTEHGLPVLRVSSLLLVRGPPADRGRVVCWQRKEGQGTVKAKELPRTKDKQHQKGRGRRRVVLNREKR